MVPRFVDIGSLWFVLPPGVHEATLAEVESRFATSDHRKHLFSGFKDGAMLLQKAGCQRILLDGSFVTAKSIPGDFDACWDPAGVDPKLIEPVLLDFADSRKRQKARFYGEFFPSTVYADGRQCFSDFFQIDKYTGNTKGIIRIRFL